MMEMKVDVAVLGGGPGGYPAAIRAAQCGKSVALIEVDNVGGTCLNRGCIPSKTLIAGAEVLKRVKGADQFGVTVGEVSFDYAKMAERKDRIVSRIRKGLEGLIAANKITLVKGFGELISSQEIKVQGQDSGVIKADKIIIATGSEPRNMLAFPFDYERIHDSTSLLAITKLPRSIVIIGGGIIGCEFASLFSAFDVKVTVLELMSRILPMEASNISDALTKSFSRKGVSITTNAMVAGIDRTAEGIRVKTADGKTFDADIALVSVGRKLNTDKIGLDKVGVALHDNGMIRVNDKMETSVAGIYAVGDIASKWWLAHVASHQGLVAANNACGNSAVMHYEAVPSVIFTTPEIATVGMSLDEALANGYKANVGAFPFQALGKSQATLHTEGFAQIIQEIGTGRILGAQVVGYDASVLIAEMALAIANELTLECVSETIHAHPTTAEAWMEAALIANETPLHFPPKLK